MNLDSAHEQLRQELETLRGELTELRAIESMHRQTQQGLQEMERQLAGIIHSAMDGIITIDEEQRIVLFNAAAETMFGCSAHDVMGHLIDRFIPIRFRRNHQRHIENFGETSVTNRRMGELGLIFGLRANGEEFPLEASISKVSVGGKLLYTVILRDVSKRQSTEEQLTLLGKIMEDSINEIYLFDAESLHFVQVNRGARKNLEYTMSELRTLTPLDITPEFDRQSFEEILGPLREKQREKVEITTIHRRKNGSLYPVEIHLQLSRVHAINVFVAIIQDISEKKGLEGQLQQAERLAEMGTLASGMAHEIGTPMNVILGRAEYLMRKTSDEKTKKGLGTIVTQVERITKIMNQLLSFARRRPIQRKPLNLTTVVYDIVEVVQERLETCEIQKEFKIDPHLPEVFADRDQMGQVVLNLIMNALQAMRHGGRLSVSLQAAEGLVILKVADTGPGIPKENLSKLFTPFFTTKEIGEGTGLGLTVVHGIVQEHEGAIAVESELGKGATFTISLPALKYVPSQQVGC